MMLNGNCKCGLPLPTMMKITLFSLMLVSSFIPGKFNIKNEFTCHMFRCPTQSDNNRQQFFLKLMESSAEFVMTPSFLQTITIMLVIAMKNLTLAPLKKNVLLKTANIV